MKWLLDWRLTVLLWVILIGAWFSPSSEPLVLLGGDWVYPRTVKRGETITISRSYVITRKTPMRVTRTMVKGTCPVNCEFFDLVHGYLLLDEGEYQDIKREHVIPVGASPGVWVLRFNLEWDDWLGRKRTMSLPELQIEVAK